MADVIITPASGLIDFQNTSGISSATIQLNGSGDLVIGAAAGDIQIGDTSSDIFVGDGVNNVDIVFEQDGEIRGETGVTVTLGQSDSFIAFAGDITGNVDFTGGLNVTGVSTFQSNVYLGDNDSLYFGAGNDLQIYSDGTNGIINSGSGGDLTLQASDDVLIQVAGTENAIVCNGNGAVDIRYNNVKKFETTTDGIKITGGIQDKDGDLGTAGQVLSSTGSQLNWIDAASGGGGTSGLSTGGVYVGSGVTTFNFVGTGITASVSGSTGNVYIPTASRSVSRTVATNGQTTVTGLSYTVGFVDVYLNGARLDSTEFTASNGSSVVLTTGASTGLVILLRLLAKLFPPV
jgi:hypothetical protein